MRFLSGTCGVWHDAWGFDTIVGYGRGGALDDKLILVDTSGLDAFVLGRMEADLKANLEENLDAVKVPEYTVLAHGFGTTTIRQIERESVEGVSPDSADTVKLTDSQWNDTLVGDPQKATMSGVGYSNTVIGFLSISATGSKTDDIRNIDEVFAW